MSLLPSRMSINDPMPSLGELVKAAIQPQRDPIKEFETGDKLIYSPAIGKLHVIEEPDCRQIKGAAQASAQLIADLASIECAAGASLIGYGAAEPLMYRLKETGIYYRVANNTTGAEVSVNGIDGWVQTLCTWGCDQFKDVATFNPIYEAPK